MKTYSLHDVTTALQGKAIETGIGTRLTGTQAHHLVAITLRNVLGMAALDLPIGIDLGNGHTLVCQAMPNEPAGAQR